MKIVVLMENTMGNPLCYYEHGLSVYIETKKHKVLLDTGPSDRFIHNAKVCGVDLSQIDTLVLSHGHYDHAGGILSFYEINPHANIYVQKGFDLPHYHDEKYIGINLDILKLDTLHIIEGNLVIDDELSIFSQIKGRRYFPQSNYSIYTRVDGVNVQDDFMHEQCLVINEDQRVLISGCAHSGILNILDRYQEIYPKLPDLVISGFHMKKNSDYTKDEIEVIENTARELITYPCIFYTGHCTGEKAIALLKPIMKEQLQILHSGLEIGTSK